MRSTMKTLILFFLITLLMGCQNLTTSTQPSFFKPASHDDQVTTSILEAMLSNEVVSDLTIHVQTTGGVVLLSGYVKTIRQSDTAEAIATKTPGVVSVQNHIIVRK